MPAFENLNNEDEEEKTTIESGWEEEASTTVEQGEVAEKIRALGAKPQPISPGHVTSTNSILEEPTIDDRHANLRAKAAAAAVAAPSLRARLVITHGNDTGQTLEVTPGKSYTIGRAIDNDFVLTDIAVSRKHFDLRHEGGSWLLADRGSGNGTIVNGQIEDQPFMLANGDVIEIGNTTFRFEQQSVGAGRNGSASGTFDQDLDEEEPSTVAGKPVRQDEPPTPMQPVAPVRTRPKTQPPPTPPSRPRSASMPPPPFARASTGVPVQGAPLPMAAQSTAPLHPQASAPMPLANVLPTTIPGQGPPMGPSQPQILGMFQPAPQPAPPISSPYPVASVSELRQMQVGSAMMARDATATAHVPPTPYNGVPQAMPPQSYALGPTLSRRAKLMIGGGALALLAAIITVAIVGGGEEPAGVAASTEEGEAEGSGKLDKKPIVDLDDDDKPTPAPTPAPAPAPTDDKKPDVATVTKPDVVDKKPEPTLPQVTEKPAPRSPVEKLPERVVDKKPERVVDKKPDPRPDPKPEKKPKRSDFADVKAKAKGLYEAKKFSDASAALRSAASGASAEDARELKSLAGIYESLGRSYFVGMASGTPPADAFGALQTARTMDGSAGGAHSSDIKAKLAAVAPKAAIVYASGKKYDKALVAVRIAESLGNRSGDVKTVRTILESAASKLYAEAAREIDSNPGAAKAKAKQIKSMVEPSSPWYGKADKLLQAG